MYIPFSSVAKTLVVQASQANMRTTGLGISASADSILDDASTDAILATLGGGTTGIAVFKDTTGADVRTEIGAGVGLTVQTKSADFTAVDAFEYEMNSSGGAIAVTLPACSAGQLIGFKLLTAGNDVTLTRNGADTIDGAGVNKVMNIAGEELKLRANAAGNGWLVE